VTRRVFTDRNGVRWDVFDVIVAPPPGAMQPAYSHQLHAARTLLMFESEHERRRLSPLPLTWTDVSDEELERLLSQATRISMTLRPK